MSTPCTSGTSLPAFLPVQVSQPAFAAHGRHLERSTMNDHHPPRHVSEPLRVVSGVCVHAAEASSLADGEWLALNNLSRRWTACLELDQAALNRLFLLWKTVLQIGADEIGDWALQAMCHLATADGTKPPQLLGVAATVYANGEVACAVSLDGIDPALWFVEVLDLSELEGSAAGVSSNEVPA
jgi:hypothetical protein